MLSILIAPSSGERKVAGGGSCKRGSESSSGYYRLNPDEVEDIGVRCARDVSD